MGLPCKHIFRFRLNSRESLFDECLVLKRWRLDFFQMTQNLTESAEILQSNFISVSSIQQDSRKPLSQQAKYRKAFLISQRIAALVSETQGKQFDIWLLKMLEFETSLQCFLDKKLNDQVLDFGEADVLQNPIVSSEELISDYLVQPHTLSPPVSQNVNVSLAANESKSNLLAHSHLQTPLLNNTVANSQSLDKSILDPNLIKMPSHIPRRGRPKGSEITVIGLPKMLLGWLVKPSIIVSVLIGAQLAEIVDILPWLKIPTKVTYEPVEIKRVRKYFSLVSWSYLTRKLEIIKHRNLWLCQACDNELCDTFVICCDHCLNWFDRKCVGLKAAPKSKIWFCKSCLNKKSMTLKSNQSTVYPADFSFGNEGQIFTQNCDILLTSKLSAADLQDISANHMLSDNVIHTVQKMTRNVCGLQDPVLGQN
nr:uncharacterized protein LOC124816066 [Hydra vulgaris]